MPDDLQRVFVNVERLLNKGGLFQFDMSTAAWFEWLAAHEKMFPVGPHYMMACNRYNPKQRIATFSQLWFVKRGRLFEKRLVTVRERAYSPREVSRMVRKAGLTLLEARVQRKLEGRPTRMLYLARK